MFPFSEILFETTSEVNFEALKLLSFNTNIPPSLTTFGVMLGRIFFFLFLETFSGVSLGGQMMLRAQGCQLGQRTHGGVLVETVSGGKGDQSLYKSSPVNLFCSSDTPLSQTPSWTPTCTHARTLSHSHPHTRARVQRGCLISSQPCPR